VAPVILGPVTDTRDIGQTRELVAGDAPIEHALGQL
jgi:hypothetical protein